jgi:hypothetical protein
MPLPVVFVSVLLLSMLACLEAGRRIGLARLARSDAAGPPTDEVDSAVAGLLTLLVAFTFSGAAFRFDGRRQLMGQEANAIGTAYLRLDVLPLEARTPLKAKFREYTDARIGSFRKLPDIAAAKAELARARALQAEIWSDAVAATRTFTFPITVLAPINEMIDVTTTQEVAIATHPPPVIYGMLGGLALVSAILIGYRMADAKRRDFLHLLIYAGTFAVVIYVILDIEYPRLGIIRVDNADEVLVDLRDSMN